MALDWSSKKLVRVRRSPLSAEAQSAANAIDMLEWSKVFLSRMIWPFIDIAADSTMHAIGHSPVITDSKGLFDASRSASSGLGIAEKRAAIEVKIINERMAASHSYWAWTSAAQQIADGLTKTSSRQSLADLLRRGTHALKYGPNFIAGKKQTAEDKRRHEAELDLAASKWSTTQQEQDAQQIHACVDQPISARDPSSESTSALTCSLPGCTKHIPTPCMRFCSRKHFYVNQYRSPERVRKLEKVAFLISAAQGVDAKPFCLPRKHFPSFSAHTISSVFWMGSVTVI